MNDWKLLREYVDHGSQAAFAQLAAQYMDLVYSTCRRELGDASLAEDATQVVFLIFTEKAATLRAGVGLSSWFFQTACFTSRNALRHELRRRQREQKVAEEMERDQLMAHSEVTWDEIEPLLHAALHPLKAQEQQAVLLRFFANKSLRETGEEMGISEEAARKRVARAVEKMRHFFSRHGLLVAAPLFIGLVSANAVQAAPQSCLQAVLHASAGTGVAVTTAGGFASLTPSSVVVASLWQATSKAMLIGKVYATVAAVGALGVVGAASYIYARPAKSAVQSTRLVQNPTHRQSKRAAMPQNSPRKPWPKWVDPGNPLVIPVTRTKGETLATSTDTESRRRPLQFEPDAASITASSERTVVTTPAVTPRPTPYLRTAKASTGEPVAPNDDAGAAAWSFSVVDQAGRPVQASVRILRLIDVEQFKMTTDAAGRVVGKLEPHFGNWLGKVFVYARGHAPVGGALREGENVVRLGVPRKLRGRVVDAGGKPLPNVRVAIPVVMGDTAGEGRPTLQNAVDYALDPLEEELFSARTDADGYYEIGDLPQRGTAVVNISDKFWHNTHVRVNLLNEAEAAEIVTQPAARLTGRLLRQDGKPYADKMFYAISAGGNAHTVTDADGLYVLGGLLGGKANIVIMEPALSEAGVPPRTSVEAVIGRLTEVPDIRYTTGTLVRVKISPPLSGGMFTFHGTEPENDDVSLTLAAQNGLVSTNLRPGKYRLEIEQAPRGWNPPPEWSAGGLSIQATQDRVAETEIRLVPAQTLTIFAQDQAGEPLAGVEFIDPSDYSMVRTDAQGRLALRNLARGELKLATGPAWEYVQSPRINLPQVGPVVVTLRPVALTSLTGRVVDDKGVPVENAMVAISWNTPNNGGDENGAGKKFARTNAGGHYEAKGLRVDATVMITASKPRHRFLRAGKPSIVSTIIAINGNPIPNPEARFTVADTVLLPLEHEVTGRVVDGAGRPVANALVGAMGGGQNEFDMPPRNITRTAANGQFKLSDLPAGQLTFVAGSGSSYAEVKSALAQLPDIVLQPQPIPVRNLKLAREQMLRLIADTDNTYYARHNIPFAMAPYDPEAFRAGLEALAVIGDPEGAQVRMWMTQLIKDAPDVARARLPKLLPALERIDHYESYCRFVWRVAGLLPAPALEVVAGEEAEAAKLRAWVWREYKHLREQNSAAKVGRARDYWTIIELADVALLSARMGAADIEPKIRILATAAVAYDAAVQREAAVEEEQLDAAARAVAILAAGGPQLVDTALRSIPKPLQPQASSLAIPVLAREHLTDALRLLETMLERQEVTANPFRNNEPNWTFGQAAISVLRRMKDAEAALKLARRVTSNSHRAQALALAAILQPPAVGTELLREAFEKAMQTRDERQVIAVSGIALSFDAVVGEECLGKIEDAILRRGRWSEPAGSAAAQFQGWANVQPGRARAWLEWKWHELQTTSLKYEDMQELRGIVLAMVTVDTDRALAMTNSIPQFPQIDVANHISWQWDLRRKSVQYLAAPEDVRRNLNFTRWLAQDTWTPGDEAD